MHCTQAEDVPGTSMSLVDSVMTSSDLVMLPEVEDEKWFPPSFGTNNGEEGWGSSPLFTEDKDVH